MNDLQIHELYEIIRLREEVFVVEQNCPYLDCDGLDPLAWHLFGVDSGKIRAYLRIFPAELKYNEVSFGQVLTSPESRRLGYGKELIERALVHIEDLYGRCPIRISAQSYLETFYGYFGFCREGQEYHEDTIPHIQMLRRAPVQK